MRAGATNIIINNQNLADANITGSEERISKNTDMTFKSRIGQGVSTIDLNLAVRFRNSFKGNNPSSALSTFFSALEGSFNNWNVGFDDILWWVVKKNFSYIEISQYGSAGGFLGNSIFGNIFGAASSYITNAWSGLNTTTSGLLNTGLGALGIGGNNFNEAGLTTFWDSASDSVGVMTNSKYLQLDSSLPIFDITQETYGVPIPFSASTENKISQDTRNLMYDLSIKNTALMRRNLLGVAYGNLQIRGNMAADATVPHSVNLINDLPTLVKLNQSLNAFVGALGAAVPNFKLFGFVKYLSNIGNQSGFNLRDNRPITSSDRDFVVITNEERAQNSANQIEEIAAQAELAAAIQAAAQAIPTGGRVLDPNTGWSDEAILIPIDETPGETPAEENEPPLPVDDGEGAPGVVEDPGDPGPDGIYGTDDDPLPTVLPITNGETVILSMGSNDEGYNPEGWYTYNYTKDAIKSLKAQGYNVVVILPNESTYANGNNGIYEQVLLAATSSGYSGVVAYPLSQNYYESDGVHPTTSGYNKIVSDISSNSTIAGVVGDSIAVQIANKTGGTVAQTSGSKYINVSYTNGELTGKTGAGSAAIAYTYTNNFIKSTGSNNAVDAVNAGTQVGTQTPNTTPTGTASSGTGGTTQTTGTTQSGQTSTGLSTTTSTGVRSTATGSGIAVNKDGNRGGTTSRITSGPASGYTYNTVWGTYYLGDTATGAQGQKFANDSAVLGYTIPLGSANSQGIKVGQAAIVTLRDTSTNQTYNVVAVANDTGGRLVGGSRYWGEVGTNTINAWSNMGATIAYYPDNAANVAAGLATRNSGGNLATGGKTYSVEYQFLNNTVTSEAEYNALRSQLESEGRIGTWVNPQSTSVDSASNNQATVDSSESASATTQVNNDGTASTTTATTDTGEETGTSEETSVTPLQQALSDVSSLLGGAGLNTKNYSNQQKAAFVSFSIKIGNTFQEVDYLLKRIVRTSLRACKSINQRLGSEPSGSYATQLDGTSTSSDLNSSLSNILGIPADSPLISAGSSLISGIFTGQNATTTLLNAGQRALGDLTGSLQSGVFGGIQQQVDGGITLLNGAGQLLGAGNLLPSTGELINALDPTQFLSTLEMPSILPNLNLGSLGELLGIAASVGQNGFPTSISGLIQMQEQIYTAICNFEIPIVDDIVTWINDWEEFFDGFEWKDIEKKLIDIVTKYIDQILERFNIFKIVKQIIENLDEQVESFLKDLWERFTDCSRYQKEDRSGREGAQSSNWLEKQPATTAQHDVALANARAWERRNGIIN